MTDQHAVRAHLTHCTGATLLATLQAAADWVDQHAARINALNVFPVPDGDTGTNMSLTIRAALAAMERYAHTTVGALAHSGAQGALLGARGNSGVILSQLLRGFAEGVDGVETMSSGSLAGGLTRAATVAYRGISDPVEGTLLTVAREAAAAAEAAAKAGEEIPVVLEHSLRAAEAAVARTPDQLDVLKRAGVVDAGGEGYRVLLEGAWMHLTGRKVEMVAAQQPVQVIAHARTEEEPPFGFCTELVLRDCKAEMSAVRSAMESLGQSVIVVGDDSLVRIHVHALRPGQVLEYAVDRGTVLQVQIENMEVQHREFVEAGDGRAQQLSRIGMVAVAAGDGMLDLFNSLGAAAVIEGGQTMNPSVQDILNAVNGAAYEELIILPNNSNVVMTANSVRALTPRKVEVVPTANVAQGVAAAMSFNFQDDLETNAARMHDAARSLHVIEVTRAAREVKAEARTVRRGDFIAIADGELRAGGSDLCGLIERVISELGTEPELVTVYRGGDATEDEANILLERLRASLPDASWELVRGGQPHYPYIIALE